jgi:predicted metal-dependent hydrolase
VASAKNQPELELGELFDLPRPAQVVEDPPPAVEVRRSARRRRTVSAYRDGDRTIVMIPARMSRADERKWIAVMLRRLDAQERRRRPSDAALLARARRLSDEYLGGRARPSAVRWVTNQASRWGSCTPGDATIRLSHRLQGMPAWVVDYVLVHELAHLIEATHSDHFWSLVSAYPRAERARGYLEGVAAAGSIQTPRDAEDASSDPVADAEDGADPHDGWDEPERAVQSVVRPPARR